jgi:cytochrome b561
MSRTIGIERTAAAYSPLQRTLHWVIALAIFGLVPAGVVMTNLGFEGPVAAITNMLYSWHKLIGFIVLWLVVLRVVVKATRKTPPLPESVARWQVVVSASVHGLIYVLLFLVPLTGWAGVTAFPALITVGGYNLPPMPFVPVDEALAKRLFQIHGAGAMTLVALVAAHIGGAMMHLIVHRDGVFQRMWPGRG